MATQTLPHRQIEALDRAKSSASTLIEAVVFGCRLQRMKAE
jgi:hypothetical protein